MPDTEDTTMKERDKKQINTQVKKKTQQGIINDKLPVQMRLFP